MKYGDTLQQRSIPEWVTYNVDYNEIKLLIKRHTSKAKAKPITIPGQDDEDATEKAFEVELYTELVEQHQRIDLFVRSKSGEIKRRLDRLETHVFALTQRCPPGAQQRISVRRLEKFSKAESEILRVGAEIQSLARFVAAQRLAFVKLLKKYKKWTGSSTLQLRFDTEVLRKPQSFTQKDFGQLLDQWTDVLTAVRAPFDADLSWKVTPNAGIVAARTGATSAAPNRGHETPPTSSNESLRPAPSAQNLDSVCRVGSNVEFDTALATVPLGRAAGRAAYWVHPDNLIQLHILLLQYTRLRRRMTENGTFETPPSSRASRQGSRHGSVSGSMNGADEEATTNTIICDDPQSFATRRNGATISDLETTTGSILEEAAMSVRCPSSKGEAMVAICEDQAKADGHVFRQTTRTAKLKRKALANLFYNSDSVPTIESNSDLAALGSEDFSRIHQWLQNHTQVQPLIHLQSVRSRFVGLGTNTSKGLWVALDKDIYMERVSQDDLKELDRTSLASHASSIAFPFAVLEVRWEGSSRPQLVKALDETHLAERVRGFSLETHAVAVLCKPDGMTAPLWLTALNRDIRKIPAPKTATIPNRPSLQTTDSSTEASNGISSPGTASTTDATTDAPSGSVFSSEAQPESPATSVPDMLEESPLRVFKKKRRGKGERPLLRQTVASHGFHQRYWNEFDDGDEAPPDEAYTILVDPNTTSSFPSLSKLITSASDAAKASAEKVYAWLRPYSTSTATTERQPLNTDYFSHRSNLEDGEIHSDPDSDVSTPGPVPQRHRRYATFPTSRTNDAIPASRERLLFHCCIASFLSSLTFLAIAAVLDLTTRRKYVLEAHIGTIVGVVASLLFAAVGMGMMVGRREDVGWLERGCVVGAFGLLVAGNGFLVAIVLGVL